jgi:hypothetical protein
MMNKYLLYQIDAQLQSLIDEETGEVFDYDAFLALNMERDDKIEQSALNIKNLLSEAEAIRAEEKILAERRKKIENQTDRLKGYLVDYLGDEKFKSGKVTASVRSSTAVEIGDGFVEWARTSNTNLLRFKEPEPDKTAISRLLKLNQDIPHAALVTHRNLQIT